MRNSFRSGKFSDSKSGPVSNTQAASLDQVAIVWGEGKEMTVVTPVYNSTSDSYQIDFAKLPTGVNLVEALNLRRKGQPNVPPLSSQTLFLTAVPDFSERTRILHLSGNVLALKDIELSEWLIRAEQELYLGTDNHPVFETALEDTACVTTRLPNGQVSMTEVPRQSVEEVQERITLLSGIRNQNIVVETPLRSTARYFLTSQPEGEDILRTEKEDEVTAFLMLGSGGFSYGLWSPHTGLFNEDAFPAPPEIVSLLSILRAGYQPNAGDAKNDSARQNLGIYLRQAFDQLFVQLSPERLEQMQLSNYAQAVWVADPELSEIAESIANEYSSSTGLEFIQIKASISESTAAGLLLGSFTFGADRIIGADVLPVVDMSRDLLFLADSAELDRQQIEEISNLKQQSRTVFAIWAPPVILLAFLLGVAIDIVRSGIMTGIRDVQADAQAQKLKPAVDRRKGYETTLKWYQEFIKQVSNLRRQQPVGTNLLYELNSNYPLNIDPNFYISEIKLTVSGGIEIKGLANNKDAVTTFLRSLEFAGGPASGSKLFSNLTYEVQEGVDLSGSSTSGQSQLPQMQGSTLQGANLAPGVIAWNIRGNYLPALEFAPPDPKKKPASNQPPNANANVNPAVPPVQPAANTAK